MIRKLVNDSSKRQDFWKMLKAPLAFPPQSHKENVDKNVPKLTFTLNNTAITIMV